MAKPDTKLPVFDIAVVSLGFCFLLSVFIFFRATKDKADFKQVKGVLEYIGNGSLFPAGKDSTKFRYLKVQGYERPFELFTGKSTGDFTPKTERLDLLKAGDTITVYFDEDFSGQAPVNRLAYFIEKNNEIFFEKGGWEIYLAFFLAGLCCVTLFWVVRLWKKRKIS